MSQMELRGWRPLQLTVAKVKAFFKFQKSIFEAEDHHSSLWSNATSFLKSQITTTYLTALLVITGTRTTYTIYDCGITIRSTVMCRIWVFDSCYIVAGQSLLLLPHRLEYTPMLDVN